MSGFKSFVDPTIIHFPSNLVGIVGPNGCGKSNIIDAVRWVMGELSAKQLRGDSMVDVIFNGSSARKPVSAASIELIFDNSDGAVGGQFSNYSEISVRREVVRDGTSNYFLNNTRCRRRDVTDLFLGTGLGPRSYAIIEQGTITRLVESKPEELRIFLEEAAGISRYKERRRETETRIHHTRENIERLNDLLEEVTKQLQHLDRQAHAAERYKELSDEKRKLEAELKALYWRELNSQTQSHDHEIREHETRVESALAELRNIESNLEKARQQHDQASDNLNSVQGRYYELGTAIARLEQSLQHMREQQSQHQKDTQDLQSSRDELQGHIDRDQDQIFHSQKSISELEPAYESALHKEQEAAAALAKVEQKFHDWQQRWESFNQESGDKSKHADVNRAHIERLERQLEQEIQRRDRLRQELGGISLKDLHAEIAALENEQAASDTAYAKCQQDLSGIIRNLDQSRADEKRMAEELHTMRSSLEDQRGRLASLEALQQEALGKSRERINQWLKSRHWLDNPRLAELINVDPGWERA
ncbi:MAG: AAA family ATPase, partial [Gammaproteobacteria bacterium]|nr:AAA family ATPase [Gammaproteobacteria bacterium]